MEGTMEMRYFFMLTLSGVLTQDRGWKVKYPDKPICAVRGFSVSIPCSYEYPQNNHVIETLWCSMNNNTDQCLDPPYVYNSSSSTTSDFEYIGDNESNCTLLIHNVEFHYSGKYKFRFITDMDRYTGDLGVDLQVTGLKVSLIGLSGNGRLKQGDSLNLTCDVNCTHSSSQFVWSKNNERLPESGPVLHFPALTLKDSGNYTCTWQTNRTSGSKSISLHIKNFDQWKILIIVLVIVVILVIVTAVIYHRRNSKEAREEKSGQNSEKTQVEENSASKQTKACKDNVSQRDDETLHKEEVTYATVFVKDKRPKQKHVHTEKQKEDDSVIYSTVLTT